MQNPGVDIDLSGLSFQYDVEIWSGIWRVPARSRSQDILYSPLCLHERGLYSPLFVNCYIHAHRKSILSIIWRVHCLRCTSWYRWMAIKGAVSFRPSPLALGYQIFLGNSRIAVLDLRLIHARLYFHASGIKFIQIRGIRPLSDLGSGIPIWGVTDRG